MQRELGPRSDGHGGGSATGAVVSHAARVDGLTRRDFVLGGALAVGTLALWPRRAAAAPGYALPEATRQALASSPLVYVSPLRRSGAESRCHGEVWFCVDEGAVLIATASDRWKARAVRSGHDRARLWVGDFGSVQSAGDRYRKAPTFVARAELVPERPVFDRLMAAFGQRYAKEWGKWEPRFAQGYADGSRVVIRYTPIGA